MKEKSRIIIFEKNYTVTFGDMYPWLFGQSRDYFLAFTYDIPENVIFHLFLNKQIKANKMSKQIMCQFDLLW